MDGGVLIGIAFIVALSVSGALMLRLLLSSPLLLGWVADKGIPRLWRRIRPPVEQPSTRPIETIAGSIQRLGGQYYGGHPGRSWVKSEAFRRAYDDALAEGCRALEVDSDLLALQPGTERDAERMRVEHLLASAGLVLRRAA